MKAVLVLEDGFALEGEAFAGEGEIFGEVVFNTSMTGYQEILTDPSYKGQIVTLTYPLIGNYGINAEDVESFKPHVEALVVREYSRFPHNWRSQRTLKEFLEQFGILGIEGIDTRALTKHIREAGAMKGVISTRDFDIKRLLEKVRAYPGLVGRDMVQHVTCRQPYRWQQGPKSIDGVTGSLSAIGPKSSQYKYRVVAFDYGVKYNILRLLEAIGCEVIVVPAWTKAEEVLGLDPDGIFLSNGPGDPAGVPYAIEEIKKLLGKKPIFGICLGHQFLGRALGLDTFKLKFGHRGGNQPVKDLATGRVEITAQNHGFCVCRPDPHTCNNPDLLRELRITHVNLNDRTLEGMEHRSLKCFSVQYHPEASPGPHDSRYLFERFASLMEETR
ncbi:MAG: glutamine-hydrolyzing carbamoyl-phosphate synthase small subunit [Clostridia bacterium]|nr:glutamine-hydrolyzing carbamoyl-phosphate synthase small subunit [Clostridia bacterium]